MPVATEGAMRPSTRWIILGTVIFGTFLGRLDQTIVNLALPKMIQDFDISISAAGWIATAYIIANAVFVPVWGKLGDTLGRKKIYILGFSIFIVGSVLAGLAWDLGSMLVFRVIQAIAGSADYPTAMAIIAVTFPAGRSRAQALGIWSSSFAAAAIFGPLLGGPLIDHFGWRSIFFINLPLGLVGIAMALLFIHESASPPSVKQKFDWWGATSLGIALSFLVLVLDKGLEWGWFSVASCLAYAGIVVFGALFLFIERRHPDPVVDLKFFKLPVFVNVLINNFIVFMALMGSVFLIPIFAQTFLGYNATQSGYLFIPMAIALMIAAPIGGSLTGRISARFIIMGSTLAAAFGIYLFSWVDIRSTAIDIMVPLGVMAFSLGFGMSQRTNVIASVVPDREIGVASSILALVRNIAGAFGISVFSTILVNVTENNILQIARESTIQSTNPLVHMQVIQLMELKAQVSAYSTVFLYASGIIFIGGILALWIKVPHERVGARVIAE